eukprot:TRINITY_DN11483_c3_g1_i1.p1 TRINITY_DN11483_c3_g1~~TRINITY_DN11483_c3_g1_i1.p1  ORF type:complete len:429 (+),score=49.15 TRINITY_DN11483_c3_g1_i1:44-1288(+)
MEGTAVKIKACMAIGLVAGVSIFYLNDGEGRRNAARRHITNLIEQDDNNNNKAPKITPITTKQRLTKNQRHVLVTGGAGYIGSHTVGKLLDLGHYVTVIDNLSRGNRGAIQALQNTTKGKINLRFVEGDIGQRSVLRKGFQDGPRHVDVVIHFAAIAYVGESMKHPLMYYKNITVNSITLFEEMLSHKVHRLVFSSTCATYGSPEKLPATENTPTKPVSPYGTAKLMVETALHDICKAYPKFQVGILRYFNVYGCDPQSRWGEWPRRELQNQHGRITNACLDAAEGRIDKVTLLGTNHATPDGTCIRDFIHVSDLVDAHIAIVPKISNPPILYNVGTGNGVSMRQLLSACRRATGVNFTIEEVREGRPGDSPQIYADTSRIQKELNWRPKFPDVSLGLAHCWKWRQLHRNGYDG